MPEKNVAVYICECGNNIKDCLNLEELAVYVKNLDDVLYVRIIPFLCSKEGCEQLVCDIKECKPDRLVIAGCSPHEYEQTFMKLVKNAGMNPFLIQIANIREHCAWVVRDTALATDKAERIIKRAVKRVLLHEPLESRELDCNTDVLIVGAGVAGIEAALTAAQEGRKVYLVDKAPHIGGKVASMESVFPGMECASCMLSPKLQEVLENEKIEVFLYSEINDVKGFLGNFTIRIKKKARSVIAENCIGCNACINVCPVGVKNGYEENMALRKAIYIPFAGSLPNVPVLDRGNCAFFQKDGQCEKCKNECLFGAVDLEQEDELVEIKVGGIVLATGFNLFKPDAILNFRYNDLENVFTAAEFSRMLNTDGPTGGSIVLKDGSFPESIAVIFCAGSREKELVPYCSGVCCMYSLGFMHLVREKNPNIKLIGLYSDLVLTGVEGQKFYNNICSYVEFIRLPNTNSLSIKENNDKLRIELGSGKTELLDVDMIVLSSGLIPCEGMNEIAGEFDITLSEYGFYEQAHNKLLPVSTMMEGVYAAGCCTGPKNIQDSVSQGGAAAGKLLSVLVPGKKIPLEAKVSEIDADLCSGCRLCSNLCPYKAISYSEEKGVSEINEVLCKGCGCCAASCPSGAAKAKHFTDKMILTEIEEILE